MKAILTILSVVVLATTLIGCETLKGAKNGLAKDWEGAKDLDVWMQENMW